MFLIDGYNLLHSFAREKTSAEARAKLVALIEAYCVRGNYRARIVFDPTGGLKRNDQRGPVEIRNVPQGRTADEEILAALRSTDDRTLYTVVSNDLAIVKAAEKLRFTVLPCEEFAKQLSAGPEAPEKGGAPSPGEVDYWMKEFGLDETILTEGLGLDSIDLVSLVVQVENKFHIKIATEELKNLKKVGELLDLLQAKL
ncbi:MAG: NYN domain-containing protein, partial [Planctomycetes bacterium]|nr:NYN domain-containing protein [Planctomycetota bacterium]